MPLMGAFQALWKKRPGEIVTMIEQGKMAWA